MNGGGEFDDDDQSSDEERRREMKKHQHLCEYKTYKNVHTNMRHVSVYVWMSPPLSVIANKYKDARVCLRVIFMSCSRH